MNKKKILIFGPISDFGGRELESSFITSVLSSRYEVAICSSVLITPKSQVFDFDSNFNAFSLKELLFNKFWIIKCLALFSFFKNSFNGQAYSYANNAFAKRFGGYDKKVQIVLEDLIHDYDVVFIIAQLGSGLLNDVISIAKKNKKKILFRTTGAITFSDYEFINSVDCFIHHSINNASKIEISKKYVIIDQCAYNEKTLLTIPLVENKVRSFLTLARLEKEKNIDIVIKAFQKIKKEGDVLYIVGDGSELNNLKKIANNEKEIIFTGFVKNNDLERYFLCADCVIISYYELETGPLTGIEAMASSRLIISATTGAMQERLPQLCYWFANSIDELSDKMLMVKNLTSEDVLILSQKIRNRYLEKYSVENIGNQYLAVVKEVLELCE